MVHPPWIAQKRIGKSSKFFATVCDSLQKLRISEGKVTCLLGIEPNKHQVSVELLFFGGPEEAGFGDPGC